MKNNLRARAEKAHHLGMRSSRPFEPFVNRELSGVVRPRLRPRLITRGRISREFERRLHQFHCARVPKYAAFFLVLLLMAGCGKKSARLQSKAVPPDKTLFANAMKYLKKNQFIKARLSFQTLINAYPDSEFTPKSFFEIGNSYYKEGGTESLLQAEAQFKDFQLFYPTSERGAEAQFKIAALHMRMMLQPERDSTHTKRAEDALTRFISKYPNHELTPVAKLFLKDVQENRAMNLYKIAQFYNSKKFYKASSARYKQIVEKYPDFKIADKVMWKLARALEKLNRSDEAAIYYARLSSEYPESERAEPSKQRLTELDKPIPPVNPVLAEKHRKVVGEGGFSLFRPLKNFAAAMGLTGQGDPYKKAIKMTAEAREAQAALAAEAAAGPAATQKAAGAEDIVISTTITKTAGSPAQSKTTVKDPSKKKKDVKKKKIKPDQKTKSSRPKAGFGESR